VPELPIRGMLAPMQLIQYILAAMLAWAPASQHANRDPNPEATLARYTSIAHDIAAAATHPDEPALFKDDDKRVRTALLLASIAFWESGFRRDVDEGQCRPPECDGGSAWTLWQMHTDAGLTFEGVTFRYAKDRPRGWEGEVLTGARLAKDRVMAARAALHMARVSRYLWTTWRPARDTAQRWLAAHPYD